MTLVHHCWTDHIFAGKRIIILHYGSFIGYVVTFSFGQFLFWQIPSPYTPYMASFQSHKNNHSGHIEKVRLISVIVVAMVLRGGIY